jgi:predicted O-methyltransferase YrrM
MATENKLAMLNLAAGCLEPGEVYLEVGAWTGCSIIGASLGHDERRFVTIDNFSQFGGPIDECRRHLAEFGAHQVELIDADVWKLFSSKEIPSPVGVYFYDGGHTFREQYRALRSVEPFLSDEALVVVDDTSWPTVAAANQLFVERRPRFELIFRRQSAFHGEPEWWNGVEVYAYRRQRAAGKRPGIVLALEVCARLGARSLRYRSRHLARRIRDAFPARLGSG